MNDTIFYFFFNLSKNKFIGYFAYFLSYQFAVGLIITLIIWAVFFSKRKMFTFSLLFLSALSSWLFAEALKFIFLTDRPFWVLNIVPLSHPTSYAFPSQHAAIFAALAISMFEVDQRLGWTLSFLAILIGISRIVIGVHYPVDVLGGWVVGIIIGFLYIRLFRKI